MQKNKTTKTNKAGKITKAQSASQNLKQPVRKAIHKIKTKSRFYRPKTRVTRSNKSSVSSLKKVINKSTLTSFDK